MIVSEAAFVTAGLLAGNPLEGLVSWALITTALAQARGVAISCGIGFTTSLFIRSPKFPGKDVMQSELNTAVFSGLVKTALIGLDFCERDRFTLPQWLICMISGAYSATAILSPAHQYRFFHR